MDAICDLRLSFLRSLSNWSVFGKGWLRRIEAVRADAVEMSAQKRPEPVPSVNYRTTKKGSSGLWVRKLQQALKLRVDGKFGKHTEAALKGWQSEQGLEADGIAGRITYRALGLLA